MSSREEKQFAEKGDQNNSQSTKDLILLFKKDNCELKEKIFLLELLIKEIEERIDRFK